MTPELERLKNKILNWITWAFAAGVIVGFAGGWIVLKSAYHV